MCIQHIRLCNKAEHILQEAITVYPEIADIIKLRPEIRNRLIDEIDTLLPCLINVIIERRLSN